MKARKTLKNEKLVTGNEAAAWAARLSRVEVIPNFPITPQTECIETIAKWVADGEWKTDFVKMDSEHSVMSAAVGASAAGARVFTASSSQGLMLMNEIMYIASGLRLPIVMATVSRGLSAPITLWSDHNDFLAFLPTGWQMIHAATNQEVLDSIIMAYKASENKKVLLPTMVNMDGYVLSYTDEPTEIPAQKLVDKFLPKYKPEHAFFDSKHPLIQGTAVLAGEDYTYFRKQHTAAAQNALKVILQVAKEWKKLTGREYGLFEKFMLDDADYVFVTQGSISTTAKQAVLDLRKKGIKAGLLRLRVIRPMPWKQLAKALSNAKAIAVVDKNVSPGIGGIMYPEIKAVAYENDNHPVISGFITGLGGSKTGVKKFISIYEYLKKDGKTGKGKRRFI